MPELPEVETTVQYLKNTIKGKTITDVWSGYSSAFYKGKPNIKNRDYFLKEFIPNITSTSINDVSRVGKNILIELSNNKTILVHMKMTGHLLYGVYRKARGNPKHKTRNTKQILNSKSKNKKQISSSVWQNEEWVPDVPQDSELWNSFNRHIRFILIFKDGEMLALSDARKFAKVTLINSIPYSAKNDAGQLKTGEDSTDIAPDLRHIGPDALTIKLTDFKSRVLRKPNLPIKQVITNQEIIAGVGNIYADESLWLTGIDPRRKVRDLNDDEFKKILSGIRRALKAGLQSGGDSTSDYRRPDGTKGGHQNMHNVYRRAGDPCNKPDCQGLIKRITLAGRGTYFCSECQR